MTDTSTEQWKPETFGEHILYHRKRLRMNQRELADKVGLSNGTISFYENDLIKSPKRDVRIKIGEILGFDAAAILDAQAQA